MMRFPTRKLAFLLVLAFIVVMTIGGPISSEMMMGNDGMMHNCPFMGVPALCNMNPLQHLSQWQKMFTATTATVVTFLLLLISLAVSLALPFTGLLLPKQVPRPKRIYQYRQKVFNALQLALARGLIHSKAY